MKEGNMILENSGITILIKTFDETHGITMCCVILNEEKLISHLIEWHKPYVDNIIIVDGGSTDKTVEIAEGLGAKVIHRKFDGHYSNQANFVISEAQNDWVLLVDADERFNIKVLSQMKDLINQEKYDCYSFIRKNYIDGKIDNSVLQDEQERLFRSYCRRVRPVHGELVGYKSKFKLPDIEENNIIHSKNSKIHKQRNEMYLLFELSYRREMGEPGAQTAKTFKERYPHLTIEGK